MLKMLPNIKPIAKVASSDHTLCNLQLKIETKIGQWLAKMEKIVCATKFDFSKKNIYDEKVLSYTKQDKMVIERNEH